MRDNLKINVALIQYDATSNIDKNLIKAKNALIKAKKAGADIALFPELWTIGYNEYPKNKEKRKKWKEKSIWPNHSHYKKYLLLAKEIGIAIVLTFLESDKKRLKFYNTAVLINDKGKDILKYRKTHLVDKGWETLFDAGKDFPVANLRIRNNTIKIGLMICYDREFPEVARTLMLNGAEIVLVPNACILENNRMAQFQSRGFENMIGVAMANYPRFNGKSVAFDGMRKKGKEYNPLITVGDNSESVVMARFDVKELRKYRKKEIWGDAYRRPSLYKSIIKNNPKPPFKRKDARR